MRIHHITSETFRLQGDDPTIGDCYVDPAELARVKAAAGIDTLGIMERAEKRKQQESELGQALPDDVAKAVDDMRKLAGIPKHSKIDYGVESPLSAAGTAKGEYMRQHDIAPGTDAWFKLWYARPGLTGENPMPKKDK